MGNDRTGTPAVAELPSLPASSLQRCAAILPFWQTCRCPCQARMLGSEPQIFNGWQHYLLDYKAKGLLTVLHAPCQCPDVRAPPALHRACKGACEYLQIKAALVHLITHQVSLYGKPLNISTSEKSLRPPSRRESPPDHGRSGGTYREGSYSNDEESVDLACTNSKTTSASKPPFCSCPFCSGAAVACAANRYICIKACQA